MKKIISFATLFAPVFVFAQATAVTDVNSLTTRILGIFNIATYLLVSLAVVFIVYNIVMYVVKGNVPEDKTAALKNTGWGLVGLAVIVSLWGLVGILTRSFRTIPANQPLPNVSNSTSGGGIPANQVPQVQ
ncbi:MAG: pilin [Candidatus Paceibacterota bacterium]|jgi:hypothetical protein